MAQDTLATLTWLVEAGADEAIGDDAGEPAGSQKRPIQLDAIECAAHWCSPPARLPCLNLQAITIGDAMAAAASANSLAELQAALEAFDGCGLKRTATNTVFADGSGACTASCSSAKRPAATKTVSANPLSAAPGSCWTRCWPRIGLDRKTNAYITNVINWRPPDNRDPSPEEAANCLPFLRRHIELASPQVIILLGAVAARHVVGVSDGIMKLRGRWMEYRVGSRMVPLMPTLHPAYLLRQPAHKKLAWRDLQSVRTRIEALAGTRDAG